jgi:hypothetical protein
MVEEAEMHVGKGRQTRRQGMNGRLHSWDVAIKGRSWKGKGMKRRTHPQV